MLTQQRTFHRGLFTRQCVACGYSDPQLHLTHQLFCPHCNCDFHQRPPRSYAEMEGFIPLPQTQPATTHSPYRAYRKQCLTRRWIAFLTGSAVMLATFFYLAFEVLQPI